MSTLDHAVTGADTSERCSQFIVLVGIDGSGKTTLLSKLHLPGVVTVDWRELREHELLRPFAPPSPTLVKQALSPLSRAMFIGGHLVGQYEHLVRPRLSQGLNVVLDSYYYKLLAKEELYGSSHCSLGELCRELPQPDCVIFVDVDPATSFTRKQGQLSAYEYFSVPHASDYIDFQTQLRKLILHRIAGVSVTYRINGEYDPGRLLAQVKSLISSYLSAAQTLVQEAGNHGD